jgi:outer membrane immunogenic protein
MRGTGGIAGAVLRNTLAAAAAGVVWFGAGTAYADGVESGGTPGAPLTVSEYIGVADWSGFYVGGQVGGAWGTIDWTHDNPNFFNTLGAVVIGTGNSFDTSSAIGGIVGGYNQQIGRFVFGLELAYNLADLSQTIASPFFPATDVFTAESTWNASITGRVGWTWDRWLWFVKGGWAAAGNKLTLTSAAAGVVASADTWVDGYIIGGGVEYFVHPGISLGLTYDYMQLNDHGEALACGGCGVGVGGGNPLIDAELKTQAVMARLNFYLTPED